MILFIKLLLTKNRIIEYVIGRKLKFSLSIFILFIAQVTVEKIPNPDGSPTFRLMHTVGLDQSAAQIAFGTALAVRLACHLRDQIPIVSRDGQHRERRSSSFDEHRIESATSEEG